MNVTRRRRSRAGFTLAEMLVYLALVTTGMIVIGGLEISSTRALRAQQDMLDVQVQSSGMLGWLRRDVEQARTLAVDSGVLQVRRHDGALVRYERGARIEQRAGQPELRTRYGCNAELEVSIGPAAGEGPMVRVRGTFVSGDLRRVYTRSAAPRGEVTGE